MTATNDSYPLFRPLFTGPLGPEWDREQQWFSHLKRQARKVARYASKIVQDDHGAVMTVISNRGDGKSTWINFFEDALEKGDEARNGDTAQWISVKLSLERFEAARPLRPVTYLLYDVAKRVAAKTRKKTQELKRLAAQIQMDENAAGQAAVAFATDEGDFITKHAEMSLDSGRALEDFAETLKAALSKSHNLLIVLDDCDLMRPQHARALMFTTLYLAERAPVLRIAATNYDGRRRLLGKAGTWMSAEEEGRLLWRILGEEVSLSPMNAIRKLMFLRWPEPKAEKGLWDGMLVWSEVLSDATFTRGKDVYEIPSNPESAKQRHESLIHEMVKVDKEKTETPAKEYCDVLGVVTAEEVVRKLESVGVAARREEYLSEILSLFPSNRREAVMLTNLLIRQREQVLHREQPFDRIITWGTFPERIIRLLVCIGYLRWPTTKLAALLWQYPRPLVVAFERGAFTCSTKEIDKDKAPEGIRPLLGKLFEKPDKPPDPLPQATIDEQWKLLALFPRAVNDWKATQQTF